MAFHRRVSNDTAILVWLLHWEGQMYQHEIAALFGVNQGRISEILAGKTFPGSEQAAREVLLGDRPRPPTPSFIRRR